MASGTRLADVIVKLPDRSTCLIQRRLVINAVIRPLQSRNTFAHCHQASLSLGFVTASTACQMAL